MENSFYGSPLNAISKYNSPRERLLSQYLENPMLKSLKTQMFGPCPPNIFVGRVGYPAVYAGPLVGINESVNAALYDDPKKWYGLPIDEIVQFRSSLVRGKKLTQIKNNRELFDLQDAVLSKKSVDMEVNFKKPPAMNMFFHSVFQPMGPTAEYEKLRLASNPSIPKKVDSIINDDLLARDAFSELMGAKFDVYYLQKLLSAGLLGKEDARKLVPTRWGITAADRIAADIHIEKLKLHQTISEIQIYSNEYLSNHFEIILLPGKWEYEQFENWEGGMDFAKTANWFLEHEYEPYGGRSDYAKSEGGGYYASRYSVAQALAEKLRRQCRVIVIREIKKEYDIPVGVWEIRENVFHAFDKPPEKCQTIDEAKLILQKRLMNPIDYYFQKSRIIPQRKLADF